jgi:hypothetical protein
MPAGIAGGGGKDRLEFFKLFPQLGQKTASGFIEYPQLEQAAAATGLPHPEQNFEPSCILAPQEAQNIRSSFSPLTKLVLFRTNHRTFRRWLPDHRI